MGFISVLTISYYLIYDRGNLGNIITAVKVHANKEYQLAQALRSNADVESSAGIFAQLSLGAETNENDVFCSGCSISSSNDLNNILPTPCDAGCVGCSSGRKGKRAMFSTLPKITPAAPAASTASVDVESQANPNAGAAALCKNFRELLWYWQEYYLRRGRDRLSIEFSTHIPFRYWHAIVGE